MRKASIGMGVLAASISMSALSNLPRKKRRKGRTLSDTPFGPPSPFETRQQRRYRERMEAKEQRKMKTVIINDQ